MTANQHRKSSASQAAIDFGPTHSIDSYYDNDATEANFGNSNGFPNQSNGRSTDERPRAEFFALVYIAILLSTFAMYVGRSLLMPIAIAAVFALLLRPIVRRLQKWHIPESIGAGIVMVSLLGLLALASVYVIAPAEAWIDETPIELRLRQIRRKLRPLHQPIANLNDATAKIENLGGDATPSADGSVRQVEIRQPSLSSTVMNTTSELAAGAALCLVLTYFLLALGDSLLKNVVQVMPRLREKKEAVQLVRNVQQGVSTYLLTVTAINAVLGLSIGLAMWFIGLPNPLAWGVMAMLLNYIPYAGAFVGSGVVFLVGVLSFDTLGHAVIAPIAYFAVNSIEGNFVTPAVVGRKMSLNPVMVFLSLAFWGWMWGIGGALLAVPLLAAFKIAAEQFKCTHPISVLIS